jgi:catechol 2,3-dioxygenase-like lactoylglutathione lyase family enzyme
VPRVQGKPPVWIGHAVLTVTDVNRAADFWREVGMREVERNEHVAVMELRGGPTSCSCPATWLPATRRST